MKTTQRWAIAAALAAAGAFSTAAFAHGGNASGTGTDTGYQSGSESGMGNQTGDVGSQGQSGMGTHDESGGSMGSQGQTGSMGSQGQTGSMATGESAMGESANKAELNGTVKGVDKAKRWITVQIAVPQDATIMKDGKSVGLEQIKSGDDVRASFDASTQAITSINVESKGGMKMKK